MMSAFQKPPQKGRTSIHREKIKSTPNPMEPTVSYRQAINLLLGVSNWVHVDLHVHVLLESAWKKVKFYQEQYFVGKYWDSIGAGIA